MCVCAVSFCHSHSSSHRNTRVRHVLIPIIAISANYFKMQLREAVPHFISSPGENWGKRAEAKREKKRKKNLFKNFSSPTLCAAERPALPVGNTWDEVLKGSCQVVASDSITAKRVKTLKNKKNKNKNPERSAAVVPNSDRWRLVEPLTTQ